MTNHNKSWLDRLAALSPVSLFALFMLWLGLTAGLRPLMLPDEGRYVGVAWEMLQSGRYGVPLLDGMPFFHKPPLFYWLTMLGLSVFGDNVLGARFASLFGAGVLALGVFLFVRHYRNPRSAIMAALMLLTQPFLFAGSQFANLDMLVASMISLTIMTGAHAVREMEQNKPYRAILAGAYALAALGMLAKGLIGFVLPGGVLLAWLLLSRRWALIPRVLWLPGIAVFLLLGLPWFLLMQKTYPGFYDYFVIYHHFKRFSQTGFNNQHPFWFYVPVLLLLIMPWSLFLGRLCKKAFWRPEGKSDDFRLLLLSWLLVILLFFSLPSSKLVGYIMPVLAPLAMLGAEGFAANPDRRFRLTAVLAAVLCVATIIGVSFYPMGSQQLARQIKPKMADNDLLLMLDEYQYDLPFYLQRKHSSIVISEWQDPKIPHNDNWRKELFDAGLFDPAVSKRNLRLPSELRQLICTAAADQTVWLWGKPHDSQSFPLLATVPPFARRGEQQVWAMTPALRQPLCQTPTAGQG